MKKINLGQKEIIHFVGIGGIGMSGLAQIMKNMGFNVQGSDQIKKVDHYVQLLKEYNETTNIYSKKSYDVLDYHISDSLNLAKFIDHSGVHVLLECPARTRGDTPGL